MQEPNKKPSSITIYDVAKEAGVSDATVSRVFNNKDNVRAATRERVLNAAEKLGYVVNLQARSLAGGKTNIIGILVPDLDSGFAGGVIHGIDHELAKADYELLLYTTHRKGKDEASYLQYIANGLTDGLILIVPLLSPKFVTMLNKLAYPYVLIDAVNPDTHSFSVNTTNWHGAYDATEYLIQLGHRRIGFITGIPHIASSEERLAGYQMALRDYRIPINKDYIVEGDFWQQTGYRGAKELLALPERPSAIFASNDLMALGAMDAIREMGLTIPHDISLVGFDDIPQASTTHPKLTTVRQPLEEIGRMGVTLLLEQLKNPDSLPRQITLATELIIRESCKALDDS